MIRAAFPDDGLGVLFGSTPGVSNEARPTRPTNEQALARSPSIAQGRVEQAILQALKETFLRAGEDGWDGYDAVPVNSTALAYAFQFLSDLPEDAAIPEIGSDRDGDVSLDWDFGPRNVFSVRIARDGTLYYAGLFGHSTCSGSETLRHGIPDAIADGIKRAIQ